MNVTIIGTGYVGLVTGTCIADLGNRVVCLDIDAEKIDLLRSGVVPIYEPGLKGLIDTNVGAGRLSFTTDVRSAVAHGDIVFIAVGTPSKTDGDADMSQVLSAARGIGRFMLGFKVVVNKSTAPVGSAEAVANILREELGKRGEVGARFSVASNPEFLKEGAAVDDFMRPDRIVLGIDEDDFGIQALTQLRALYAPFNRNRDRIHVMDVRSAELTKYAANAMLATRISFMNDLANLAEHVGADIELVRQGIGSDPRIGYSFIYAGVGYGGSCFPKDVQALIHTARKAGRSLRVLEAVEAVNADQKKVLSRKLFEVFGESLHGRRFAVWGLAFKPETDDMRAASSRVLVSDLVRSGAQVVAHDPVAGPQAMRAFAADLADESELLANISFADSPLDALVGADALVIVTEWKAYRSPDFGEIVSRLRLPIIIDGRNLFSPAALRDLGIRYYAIGRPSLPVMGIDDCAIIGEVQR